VDLVAKGFVRVLDIFVIFLMILTRKENSILRVNVSFIIVFFGIFRCTRVSLKTKIISVFCLQK
jgi:hypothetical protein